jgi:hypothetical protein
MCDYDVSYEEISSRDVITRKPHKCDSCMERYPAGTPMQVAVGLSDGELGRTYACPACRWGLNQPEHSTLHLCWGWSWGDGYESTYEDKPKYDYIRRALAAGVEPNAAEFEAKMKKQRQKEDV